MDNSKKAFTLVELVVVVVIISILSTIGFNTYTSYIADSRDSTRKTNFSEIHSALNHYKTLKGNLPIPNDYFKINNSGATVAWQGTLNKNTGLSTLEKIPYDPKLEIAYKYSITANKKEFEISGTLENSDFPISLLTGNYKSVTKNVLPTITLATGSISEIEINSGATNGAENRKLFVFNSSEHNLVYDFELNTDGISDGTDFDTLLSEAEENNTFSQNTSYFSCSQIKEAGKNIGEGEYQVRTSTGGITNTGCLDASNY